MYGDTSAAKARVTDVAVDIFDQETLEDGTFVWDGYAYPSANGFVLAQLRFDWSIEDIDAWCDGTGFEWPRAVRDQLRSQLPVVDRPRRTIVGDGDLGPQVDDGIAAVVEHNQPPVFYRRGGQPSEIVFNERDVPSARIVSVNRMRDRQRAVATWVSGAGKPMKPPSDVCAIILESPHLHLPMLDTIVEHPVLAVDANGLGRISTRRGYDPASATYFAPSVPLPSLDVPAWPSGFFLRVALSYFDEVVGDFAFRSEADKANALAMMLTPILRPYIKGSVPLAAVRAVKAGTGKTLLVKAMLRILTGRDAGFTSLGTDENEAEKRLLADLLAGGQFVILDNVPTGEVLKSAALARALTTGVLSGRIITTSKQVSLPVRCTWVATGNNLTMSDEIARRSYLIEFSPELERPDLRDSSQFAHPELLGWIDAERARLLSALLVIVQAWAVDGLKETPGPVLASYEEWSRVVGSVLRFATEGTGGAWRTGSEFLTNEARKREICEDSTSTERELLLREISRAVGDKPFTLKGLWDGTNLTHPDLVAAIQPFIGDKHRWSDPAAVTLLGYAIRPWVDGVYGGLRLVRDGKGKFGQKYRIRGVLEGTPTEP